MNETELAMLGGLKEGFAIRIQDAENRIKELEDLLEEVAGSRVSYRLTGISNLQLSNQLLENIRKVLRKSQA